MWDKIKKAINSNLSKPLDTFMTEQFASWATQRGRLDATISSRATNDGVWLEPSKTLSLVVASDTTQLSFATIVTLPTSGAQTLIFKFLNNHKGNVRITFDYLFTTNNTSVDNGLEIFSSFEGIVTSRIIVNNTSSASYKTASFEFELSQGIITILGSELGYSSACKVKNFKVQYTPLNVSAPVLM